MANRSGRAVKALSFFCEAIDDACLANLAEVTTLEVLELYRTGTTDLGLAHLASLTRLRRLDLSRNWDITDEGISHITGLGGLAELDLSGVTVTDFGLGHLHGFTALEKLSLFGTSVSVDGLWHLKDMDHLVELKLPICLTASNLAGLIRNLQRLRSLKRVSFAGPYSEEGPSDPEADGRWAALRGAMPECEFNVRLI